MTTADPGRVPRPRHHSHQSAAPAHGLLRVRVQRHADRDVIVLIGEVDLSTAPQVRSAINGLLVDGRLHIVVDLDGVTFLDAAALHTLITATRSVADAGGVLHLTDHRRCMQLLGFTGETHLVNVTTSVGTSTQSP